MFGAGQPSLIRLVSALHYKATLSQFSAVLGMIPIFADVSVYVSEYLLDER